MTALTFGDRLGDLLRDSGMEFEPAEHHEDGRVLPDEENRGSVWRCSCGRLFPTQRARSVHEHNANQRRRMGI